MSTPVAAPAASGASAAPAPSSSAPAPSSGTSSTPSPSSSAPAGASAGTPAAAPKGTSEAKVDAQVAAAAKAEEARKWKLKVNEQEREVTEDELVRRAQLGYSADEKFKEASEMRTAAEKLVQALKTNPLAVLQHPELGINLRELAESYLAEELQKEMLPPEQRELNDLREWKRKQEEAAQQAEQQRMTTQQQQAFQQHMQRAAQEYDTKITDVLKASNLPKTPYSVKRVAELLKGALEKGYDLDVQTAVDMVRDNYMGDFKAMFGGLKGENLIKFLGDDVAREVRQFDLARIKAQLEAKQTQQAGAGTPPPPRQNDNEPKQMRQEEWLEHIRRKAGV